MNIYIWGTGKNAIKVLQSIKRENCVILGFIDNDPDKQGTVYEGINVIGVKQITENYDYIVISVVNYAAILYQINMEGKINPSQIIVYFDNNYAEKELYWEIIDSKTWRINILEQKISKMERDFGAQLRNLGYEIADGINKNLYRFPIMGKTEDAIEKIVNEGCSLVRYGDGEFEFMAGKERLVYQSYNSKLAERLRDIIKDKDDKLLVGIANNYGNLDQYTDRSANGIRFYMTEEVRRSHLSMLEQGRTYYDAYMFKCFLPYKDQTDTEKRIELVKRIWNNRNIVIVEGDETRAGAGNDLFNNAKSIRRILTPTKNVYDKYDLVLEAACKVEMSSLILVVLGPTANLLVYDLMKKGYQAIDIGQIDMDYEWYKAGIQQKLPIRGKYVSQLPPAEVEPLDDKEYIDQIIDRI